jgi:hypothetical protein
LLSRGAAEAILNIREKMVRNVDEVDDLSFGATLRELGIMVENTHSEAFLGHSPMAKFWVDRVSTSSLVSECRRMSRFTSGACRQKYARLNSVVFLHSWIDSNLSYSKYVFEAPNDWWYWNVYEKWTINVCRSESDPNLISEK